MQPPHAGRMRQALLMGVLRWSYTTAMSHRRSPLILLRWILMATAWFQSMTFSMRGMRWTASTCYSSSRGRCPGDAAAYFLLRNAFIGYDGLLELSSTGEDKS